MWLWFGAAAMFVLLEMITGTFYLLLIALGLTASGAATYFGAPLAVQIICGMVVSLAGLAAVYHYRKSKGYKATQSDANINPDIGKRVTVLAWNDNGTAQVFYRGANWSAEIAKNEVMLPGEHTIYAVHGLVLVLRPYTNTSSSISKT